MSKSIKKDNTKELEKSLELLAKNKLEAAKKSFSSLLGSNPEEIEYQSGFFCAGWWLNRDSRRRICRGGRPRAYWLIKEWKHFFRYAKEKGYEKTQSLQCSMKRIMGEAAENFRNAFQQEGSSTADPELLKGLAICLMQIHDYVNAIDILYYAYRKSPHNIYTCFLLGEALCCTEKKEQIGEGFSYYREAFLIDFHVAEPDFLYSPLSTEIFLNLSQENKKDINYALNWFPAYLFLVAFDYPLRDLKSSELSSILNEVERLSREIKDGPLKYRSRVQASLSFYILNLIYHYRFSEKHLARAEQYEVRLQQMIPEFYEVYLQKIKKVLLNKSP